MGLEMRMTQEWQDGRFGYLGDPMKPVITCPENQTTPSGTRRQEILGKPWTARRGMLGKAKGRLL